MGADRNGIHTIEVDNLSVRSKNGSLLLDGLSFCVTAGEILVVSGASGSGKTLCAQALCGLLPDSLIVNGRVSCEGAAYVGEDPDTQIVTLTVLDEVASALEYSCVPASEIEKRCADALHLMGLSGLEHRNPWSLSGGQRQRLALACAIARRSSVLVLDNPCANIDVEGRALVYRAIRARADQGVSVVLFERRENLPEWADELVVLSQESRDSLVFPSSLKEWGASGFNGVPSIKMRHVSLGRNGRRLSDVSLDLSPGNIYLLAGTNGCGKTSLMSVLGGAANPNSGTLWVGEEEVRRLPDGLVDWAQQNPERQFSQTTVKEEIGKAIRNSRADGPLSEHQISELSSVFDKAGLSDVSPYVLSAGKKRVLGILLALISNRPMVMLDEPTANLEDSGTLNSLLRIYADGGGIVLVSSHDAERLQADETIRMEAGCVRPHDAVQSNGRERSKEVVRANAPAFNPLTTVFVLICLVALGVMVDNPHIVVLLSIACLLSSAAFHRSFKRLLIYALITVCVGLAFALIALRGSWYGVSDVSWSSIAKHGALGSIVVSASLWAGSLTNVRQLADALSQRLGVPYTFCSLALSGSAIASFLGNAAPLITAAARLKRVVLGRRAHNLLVHASLPIHISLPLFVESIRHAEHLSTTLASRGFGITQKKTFRFLYPWRVRDGVMVASVLLVVILAFCVEIGVLR